MKFSLIIFLIVCCVCHQVDSAPPRRSPPPPPPPLPPPPPSYTLIQMVMSWPPTYCQSGNPCKDWSLIRKNFGLHGLWPADSNGISVIDCRGPSIQTFPTTDGFKAYLSKNQKLVNDLSTYWPSIVQTEQGYPFWQRQWNKHGVCSNSKLTTMPYFDKAAEQSKNHFDLLGVLAGGSIVPSATALYTVTQIESAVQRKIGTNNHVYISCLRIGQEIMLREIFICLDEKARGYVSCPVNQDTRGCGVAKPAGWIKIPPFPA